MQPRSLGSRRVVLGGTPGEPLRIVPATLHLAEGRIEGVEEGVVEADEDLGDRLVSPAFVNAHTHLAMCFARGLEVPSAASTNRVESFFFELESRLTHEQVRAFARMGAYESLLAGVGFVWEHYYFGSALVEALEEVGLCGAVAPTVQDLSGPGAEGWEAALETTRAIAQDSKLAAAGIFAAVGPHATDTVSHDLWTQVVALSKEASLPVHMHAAQSVEEYERAHSRHGCSPMAWLEREGVLADITASTLFTHAIFASEEDLQRLDPARHHLVWCPRSAAFFGYPADPARWDEKGMSWVVASDAAASNDFMDPRAELFEVARLRASSLGRMWADEAFFGGGGLEAAAEAWSERETAWTSQAGLNMPASLLSRVWSRPGALHPRARCGALMAGALANLIVWDESHPAMWPARNPLHTLCFSAPQGGAAIHNLMTVGRWRGEAGDFTRSVVESEAYRAARDEADARLAELLD